MYLFSNVALFVFAPQSGTAQISFFSATDSYVPPGEDLVGWLHAMWVPWVVLAIPLAALVYRLTRTVLFDVADDDALRSARAKGLTEGRVQRRHALPLALPPVLGLVSATVALMITNIALIESPFNLPGAFRNADIGQFHYSPGDTGVPSPTAGRRPGAHRRVGLPRRLHHAAVRRAAGPARPPRARPGLAGTSRRVEDERAPRLAIVIGGLMLVMLLASLDQTIVSTALPTIVGDLGGLEHLSWVVTAYLLAITVVTPLYGKLGDRSGARSCCRARSWSS